MTVERLKSALDDLVALGVSLEALKATVRQFRDEGGDQDAALAALQDVRRSAPLSAHDTLFELRDWIMDWSAPRMKNWDDPVDA